MLAFPAFLKVHGRCCVVIGGEPVARGRAGALDVIAAAAGEEFPKAPPRPATVRSRLRRSYATPAKRAAAVRRLLDAGWIGRFRHGAGEGADALLTSLIGEAGVAEPAHEVDPCTP